MPPAATRSAAGAERERRVRYPRLAGCALALLTALAASGAMAQAAAPAPARQALPAALNGVASPAKLQLRWELQRNLFSAQAPHGRSQAHLILTNHDSQALPPQGWSLYFNLVGRPEFGELPSKLVLEQVAGGLFRLRPGPGFDGLAPGGTLDIVYFYPDLVIKLAKAPAGPYLVYDATPTSGAAS
jgi:hexosaminidase